ncbi:rap GTPase-activating protein, putative [Entamoeba invadens IP1]|uniref:Rap GTPase-activating protein, putative n=1 Tax=Entamoeba invadens IP1 TaxID=370355 RepID=A0A0A1U430_ENTIV|nr:rap GTPase-activating protein, putative [Entamoeba invadens IP1]ELP88998.1 rap GTPase-activating protein, putative [Entamoeba invadens IP1]|eukprot:XP_004255769.1 rap GTPase-activating protein, putative [Entamoeba invadens IP1]
MSKKTGKKTVFPNFSLFKSKSPAPFSNTIPTTVEARSKTPNVESNSPHVSPEKSQSKGPTPVPSPRKRHLFSRGNQTRRSFCAFEEKNDPTGDSDMMMLFALKDLIGVGSTDAEKMRSAMLQIKLMFEHPSDPLVFTAVRDVVRPNKRFITKESLYYIIMDSVNSELGKIYDCWSSLALPLEVWTTKFSSYNITETCVCEGLFHIESDGRSVSHLTDLDQYEIVNREADFTFFKQFFYTNPLSKYYVYKNSATILCYQETNSLYYVMSFKANGLHRFVLSMELSPVKWYSTKTQTTEKPIRIKTNQTLLDQMVRLESQMIVKTYKIGVLYSTPGQQNEDEMYANTQCSDAFWKFMDLIAVKKEQKNWGRFCGGLDNTSGTTGEYFYFTVMDNYLYEIVYHVAPLLPDNKTTQKLERKRHVGNDVVVVVFKEMSDSTDTFNPNSISSHLNHIFIVVTPEKNDATNERYKINVVCKEAVVPFPPFLKDRWYPHNETTKNFISKKIVNGERTCMLCGVFVNNSVRSTERMIGHIINSSLSSE